MHLNKEDYCSTHLTRISQFSRLGWQQLLPLNHLYFWWLTRVSLTTSVTTSVTNRLQKNPRFIQNNICYNLTVIIAHLRESKLRWANSVFSYDDQSFDHYFSFLNVLLAHFLPIFDLICPLISTTSSPSHTHVRHLTLSFEWLTNWLSRLTLSLSLVELSLVSFYLSANVALLIVLLLQMSQVVSRPNPNTVL